MYYPDPDHYRHWQGFKAMMEDRQLDNVDDFEPEDGIESVPVPAPDPAPAVQSAPATRLKLESKPAHESAAAPVVAAAPTPAPEVRKARFCPYCGTRYKSDTAKFCSGCGKPRE